MPNTKLGEMQFQFAEIVWHYAPLPSGELVRICQQELNWKKPTTYTVLRKLCEKGLFKNEDGLVSVLIHENSSSPPSRSSLWNTRSADRCLPLSQPLPPARSCLQQR